MDAYGYVRPKSGSHSKSSPSNKTSSGRSGGSTADVAPSVFPNVLPSEAVAVPISALPWGDWKCGNCQQMICADRKLCYYCKCVRIVNEN